MIHLIRTLFGNNKEQKREVIRNNQSADDTKSHYDSKMLEIQSQAKIIQQATKEITRIVDTTTSIAVATGSKRRGYR